jgi:hypothetical protein
MHPSLNEKLGIKPSFFVSVSSRRFLARRQTKADEYFDDA